MNLITPWWVRRYFFTLLCVILVTLQSSYVKASTNFTVDGNLSEWVLVHRLDAAPWQRQDNLTLYGQLTDTTLFLALSSLSTPIGSGTTLWLGTDRDESTGHLIWGWAGGAEYRVEITNDLTATLFDVSKEPPIMISELEIGLNADQSILEIAIPLDVISDADHFINIFADINDVIFHPAVYSDHPFTVSNQIIAPIPELEHRIAIISSPESSVQFYNDKAYAQLILAMQHQAMMAGVPYDFITMDALTDINNITGYKVILIPYANAVPRADAEIIADTLYKAIYQLGIGVLVSGDFMTQDESGALLSDDPYQAMKKTLGLTISSGSLRSNTELWAENREHPILAGITIENPLHIYDETWVNSYSPPNESEFDIIATDTDSTTETPAVLVGRDMPVIHFNTPEALAYSNLAWRSLQWLIFGESPTVALKLTRQTSLFIARNDMDLAMYPTETKSVTATLLELIKRWKEDYNFVGSYYVDIGNNPAAGEMTNWKISRPLYKDYMKLGNEIGSHSYTHPFTIDALTESELEFEFAMSKALLEKKLGIEIRGTALPGNPESLATALLLSRWLPYISGAYSGETSGYPGAIGFLSPDNDTVYFSPNLFFDYTLVEVNGLTAEQASDAWSDQLDTLMKNASQPIIHWPWHDYGPTTGITSGYSVAMYEGLIRKAYELGTEFTTARDVEDRIRQFTNTNLTVETFGDTTFVTVGSRDETATRLGAFCLQLDTGAETSTIRNWYAFDGNHIFLPESGGQFEFVPGGQTADVTRITTLPMRSLLVSITGDGKNLAFSFKGQGEVTVQLADSMARFKVTGANAHSVDGNKLTILFNKDKLHTVTIAEKNTKKR